MSMTEISLTRQHFRLSDFGIERDQAAMVDGTTRDSTNSPTTRIRAGTVLGAMSDGTFVDAGDSAVVASTQAYVDSSEAPDGDWTGQTLTVTYDGVTLIDAYTLTGNDLTTIIAELSALSNVDKLSFTNDGSGNLRISSIEAGPHHITVASDLSTAYGGSTQEDLGDDGDYRVLLETIDVEDPLDGTDKDVKAKVAYVGDWDESELLEMTDEARRVLLSRGSRFR